MNKTRLYILLSILPFLAFITNVKAVQMDYDFSGYNKASQVQFGLYNNTTLVQDALTTCTSSNDGFCAFENGDLSNTEVSFNNMRFVIRGTDGVTFTSGGQYKMSFFFLSNTSDYYITAGTLTNTTGVSYQNFSNWTSNELGIVSSNIISIETQSTGADTTATLYRVDIVFSVSSSTVAGFNIRLYRNNKTIYSTTPCDIELFRYFSVSEVTPGSIDYSQDLNNINQSIGGLSDDISDSTQDIIDNQNQNAQDIQDTINDNFQSCRDSNNLFNYATTNYVQNDPVTITGTGNNFTISSSSSYGVRAFSIGKIDFSTLYRYMSSNYSHGSIGLVVTNGNTYSSWNSYTSDRTILTNNWSSSSYDLSNYQGKYLWIQLRGSYIDSGYSNVTYTDFVLSKVSVSSYEAYGQQVCVNKLDEQNNAINGINNSITDDNVSGANSSASNFFSNFTTETYGLTSVITSPLTFIQSLTSKTCSSLVLPLPYVNRNLELPCMRGVYEQHFGGFLSIYQTITFGIISYWVVVRIFNLVKDFKNPDHDEIEVMDL